MTSVDPTNIPKLMTPCQLEWWVLFGICVAGKGAKQTEKKLNALLDWQEGGGGATPFQRIAYLMDNGKLGRTLRFHRIGQYKRINKAFRKAIILDLSYPTVEMFEAIPGIGPKTARMIMLYYNPQANCVPLDTHILKFLKEQGIPKVPKSTPAAGPTYTRLEKEFQNIAASVSLSVRELDTRVWKSYARI